MRFHSRTVDENLRGRSSGAREELEQFQSDALLCPPHEAVVERFPRPILARSVDPAGSGFQRVNDPADYTSSIDARLALNRPLRNLFLDFNVSYIILQDMCPNENHIARAGGVSISGN